MRWGDAFQHNAYNCYFSNSAKAQKGEISGCLRPQGFRQPVCVSNASIVLQEDRLRENHATVYIYGAGNEPLYEEIYNNSNYSTPTEQNSYLFMGSRRVAKYDSTGLSYYFTDHLGSTRIVRDASGNCTYNDYAPFGADFGTGSDERYKFTGKEDDGATGLQYFNARYYDPEIGRFVSEDPVKDGWNWYKYVKNSPLRRIDPDGKLSREAADSLIIINYEFIMVAADKFDVPPLAVASAIFIEQHYNVNLRDFIIDTPLGYTGLDTSLGD